MKGQLDQIHIDRLVVEAAGVEYLLAQRFNEHLQQALLRGLEQVDASDEQAVRLAVERIAQTAARESLGD